MEKLLPVMVSLGLTSLAVVVASATKIIIVRMVIRDAPSEHRAEILRATATLFKAEDRKRQRSVDST